MEVCLFNPDLGKSEKQLYTKYSLPYAFKLIDSCSELLEFINSRQENVEIYARTTLVRIFEDRFGELLPPLINAMWGMHIDAMLASQMLPHVYRLMRALTQLMTELPGLLYTTQQNKLCTV